MSSRMGETVWAQMLSVKCLSFWRRGRRKWKSKRKGLSFNPFPLFLLWSQHTFVLSKKTDLGGGWDEGNTQLGQKLTQLHTEIMVCISGTCSVSSFSSCLLFHLTAKIKAYNQILLIGPEDGDRPTGSPLALSFSLLPRLARSCTVQRMTMSPGLLEHLSVKTRGSYSWLYLLTHY